MGFLPLAYYAYSPGLFGAWERIGRPSKVVGIPLAVLMTLTSQQFALSLTHALAEKHISFSLVEHPGFV